MTRSRLALPACFLVSALGFSLGAFATELPEAQSPAALQAPAEVSVEPARTPEPNAALLAGLGGVILLVFIVRRR